MKTRFVVLGLVLMLVLMLLAAMVGAAPDEPRQNTSAPKVPTTTPRPTPRCPSEFCHWEDSIYGPVAVWKWASTPVTKLSPRERFLMLTNEFPGRFSGKNLGVVETTHTHQGGLGRVCVQAFRDEDSDDKQGDYDPLMWGCEFSIPASESPLYFEARGRTTGGWVCVDGLPLGDYPIYITPPSGYQTLLEKRTVSVGVGNLSTQFVQFAFQPKYW